MTVSLCVWWLCDSSGLGEEGETGDVAEMPADLDIEVEPVAMDEYEQEVLRADTK